MSDFDCSKLEDDLNSGDKLSYLVPNAVFTHEIALDISYRYIVSTTGMTDIERDTLMDEINNPEGKTNIVINKDIKVWQLWSGKTCL